MFETTKEAIRHPRQRLHHTEQQNLGLAQNYDVSHLLSLLSEGHRSNC